MSGMTARSRSSARSERHGRVVTVLMATVLCSLYLPLFPGQAHAETLDTLITSDTLEYFSDGRKYIAKGSVRVEKGDAVAEADEMTYFEETGDVHARGSVKFDDATTRITAESAELNMDRKTGKLHGAEVLFKEDNYRISGRELERKGEKSFASTGEARVTTCDGLPPAWCFRGRDVDLVIGDQLISRDTTLRVRDVPVFYTPRMWAPVSTERKTGFLMPLVSNSSARGFGVNIPFFWAIAENRDATFVLDTYSKRGIGTGLEYRYVEPGGITSQWWAYHIRDRELATDFTEFRALHENRTGDGPGWFLNVNYVNEKDFYREFNPHKEKQIQRFLESTGELSIPIGPSRLYLLSQYWLDLQHNTGDIPQRLPELGYVVRYTPVGVFLISAEASAANFWRKDGVSAQRGDIYPRVLHSLGSDVVLTQVVAARGTVYALSGKDREDSDLRRTAFEYDANVHARFLRSYGSLTHVVEPTLRYHFISSSEQPPALFDEKELFRDRSRIELSLLNRILRKGKEIATVRITEPFDADRGDRPFRPLSLEIGMRNPLPVKLTARYNVHDGRLRTLTSEVKIPFRLGAVNVGQRYNRAKDITVYKAGIEIRPVKAIELGLDAWYDAKGEGLTNLRMRVGYVSQCWGVRFEAAKRPGDFSLQVIFDLYGITAKAPKPIEERRRQDDEG